MTYEEAIKWLKEHHCPDDWECDCKDTEAMRLAIEALEKQVPKKPIVDEWERVKCANGHNIPVLSRNQNMPYCPFCGQHIDWSDDE